MWGKEFIKEVEKMRRHRLTFLNGVNTSNRSNIKYEKGVTDRSAGTALQPFLFLLTCLSYVVLVAVKKHLVSFLILPHGEVWYTDL